MHTNNIDYPKIVHIPLFLCSDLLMVIASDMLVEAGNVKQVEFTDFQTATTKKKKKRGKGPPKA